MIAITLRTLALTTTGNMPLTQTLETQMGSFDFFFTFLQRELQDIPTLLRLVFLAAESTIRRSYFR